ncbi:MAG: MamI family restriction endonuclease [Longimicrobiales bacterium]
MGINEALDLLELHYSGFHAVAGYALITGHTVPSDTKSWSEIFISLLTEIRGRERQKGSDLVDGSDVKAANVWEAIDTPRFNGVLPAGRKSAKSKKPADVTALDDIPYLFFVLWDHEPDSRRERVRVWVVRPPTDPEFRKMASGWYADTSTSRNFQLHPPRNENSNVIRNSWGNLEYPLLFCAVRQHGQYHVETYNEEAMHTGVCRPV